MKHKYGVCCVIGMGPECFNDNANGATEEAKKLRSMMREELDILISEGYRVFVFSADVGTNIWIHQALNGVKGGKIRRVLVLPNKEFEPDFGDEAKGMLGYFKQMLKRSNKIVYAKNVYTYMLEHCDAILSVHDGKKSGDVYKALKQGFDADKTIYVLDPKTMEFQIKHR